MPPLAGAFRPVRLAGHQDAGLHTSPDYRIPGTGQREFLRPRTILLLATGKLGI